MAGISINDALTDRNLLGAALGDLDSWATWRVILKAAFAEPMSADELIIFKELAGGREPPASRVPELWVQAGRRSGKTRTAGAICAYLAAFSTHKLAAGETATVLSLAASKSQAKATLDYAAGFLSASPVLRQLLEGEPTTEEIKLKGNISIGTHSANFKTVRGRTLLGAVFDESAFWRDQDTSANPDFEIYSATLPALATTGGMLVGISSPYRRAGLLFRKHEAAFGKNDPNVLVIQAPTLRLNPTLDVSVIDRARQMDPEAARSEWDAQFRDDLSDFVSRTAVMQCVEIGVRERPYDYPHRYVGFVDPSGGSSDSMTMCVAHLAGDVAVVDAIREVRPPFNPEAVVSEFCTLFRSYRISTCYGDRYAAEWVASQFRVHGVHYRHSEKTKSELFLDLLPRVNSRTVSLLDDDRSISQLCALERQTTRAGRDSVSHPPGGFDDCINAIAGSVAHVPAAARRDRKPGGVTHEGSGSYNPISGKYGARH